MVAAGVAALALGGPGAALAVAAPGFSYAPASPIPGEGVTFTASDLPMGATGVGWNFGDGASATGDSATHPFTTPGDHTVTLNYDDGTPEAIARTVTVNAPPVAAFTAPTVAQPNTSVAFDASGSTDSDGTIVSYAWTFGDSETAVGPTATASHSYTTPATVPVTLTVTDSAGATASVTHNLRVNAPPAVDFTFAVPPSDLVGGQPFDVPLLGQLVAFASTASDSDGIVAKYEWDLNGDGLYSENDHVSPVAPLAVSGYVPVTLRVTDNDGAVATASHIVHVDQAPVASFTYAPTAPNAGQRISFDSTSSDPDGPGDLTALRWDLDDNGTFGDATGATATRVFATAGTYPVALEAIDSVGVQVVELQHVTVRIAGSPSASGSPFTSTFVATPQSGTSSLTKVTPSGRRLVVVGGVRVAIAGRVFEGATRITRLVVNGPAGAHVGVRCIGAGCPTKQTKLTVARGAHRVRVRALERTLGAGARVYVSVTKNGFIGKQIQFTIRRTQPPVRRELCLMPGKSRATRCTS